MKRRKEFLTKAISTCLILMITFTTIPQSNIAVANASEVIGTENEVSITPTPEISEVPTSQPASPTPEISISEAPTPEITITVTPTPLPEIPTGAPTTTPEPTTTPNPTIPPTITPTPVPTQVPYRSKTLEFMSTYDYIGKSVTGISSSKVSVTTLQNNLKNYGRLYGVGMSYEDYKKAMGYVWEDATEYDINPVKITVDINKTMNYNTYVSILKKLSRYDGVYLYKIGKSTEGRDLYAIEIDMDSPYSKNVIMQTGQVHAREFAGGTYIVKEFVDLVQKAQTDKKTMELLKKNKYVAVPIINVDGREAIINNNAKWTSGGELLKAYTNGTDGGRNFPGLQWGQVAIGNSYKQIIAKKPAYANYPGPSAGSNSETKAMMKWLYHYIVVEQADLYLDMHQQGSIVYAGKGWQTQIGEQYSRNLRKGVLSVLNNSPSRRKYNNVYESNSYGLQGEGSSLTDYAVTLAVGAKFSPAYGFSAFTDGKKEYILMQIKDMDRKTIKFKEANKNFAAITMEIGYGTKYLGNSTATRSLLASEYFIYNYSKLLEALPRMIN